MPSCYTGFKRIARGGCYADYPDDIRSARRTAFAPMACISGISFRTVVIVPVKTP